MSFFKCKMCGGTIEFNEGDTIGVCDSCGTKQTLPRLDSDRKTNLYDRANHFRRNNEFDKAMGIYETILNEDPTDAEAYWSIVLCRYGIEYVEDPATHKRIPTVNRAQFTSIFDDEDYKSALINADILQRAIYEDEAKAINEIQKSILEISSKEEPFDVFICYKETDANGRRTPDSVLATDLYHQLTQEGFKVFFSRITLEDKLGTAYEPYIFAALNSSKAMVALGTKPEYFNAVWVKNEWSRYLALIKGGAKKTLIPAYRDMDPYDLPEEFSHLQAQDMSKLGFMQDLIRGIKKIVKTDEPKPLVKETTVIQHPSNSSIAPLLRRVFMFLEDCEWDSADEYCEKILDVEPENADAYLGKLMAELHVRKRELLKDESNPFDTRNNYQKVMRFGNDKLKAELSDAVTYIKERNENARLNGIYNNADSLMRSADTEDEYKKASSVFRTIPGFKNADDLAEECIEKAENCRKDAIYSKAKSLMDGRLLDYNYESAIRLFGSIPGWRNADEQINACREMIEEIKARQETERLERDRKAEEERIAAEKAAKKRKKTIAILLCCAVACIVGIVLLFTVIIPSSNYNEAKELYNAGRYDEAVAVFQALNGYKDSAVQIEVCRTVMKDREYDAAVELYNAGRYLEAATAFQALNGYKDSLTQVRVCRAAIKDKEYDSAVELYNAGKYEEALIAFQKLNGYKDSETQIEVCRTAIKDREYDAAMGLYHNGNYREAYLALMALSGYKDSASKASEIYNEYKAIILSEAKVGDTVIFGSYEQDNNKSNGKEAVEWFVLAKEGDKVLVISRYALDCPQYNTSTTKVTWETCSLRKWLNGTFISSAFNSDEQAMIQSVKVPADKNPSYSTSPGEDTTDQVFLLSISEVNKYFDSDEARKCVPTEYAIDLGAYPSRIDNVNGKATCFWWLRSPGIDSKYAASVEPDGSVHHGGFGVYSSSHGVRPALWINP